MKNVLKRAATLFLSLAVVLSFTPFVGQWTGGAVGAREAYAEGEYPDIQNVNISEDGVLTWDPYPGAAEYWVHINGVSRPGDPTGYLLNDRIDTMIEYEGLVKRDSYRVRIEALNESRDLVAVWETTYEYASPASPIEIGEIQNVKNTDGVLTWDEYPGAAEYWVGVNGLWDKSDGTRYSLDDFINRLFLIGEFPENGTYTYAIEARNARHSTIAKWEGGEYTYTVKIRMEDTEVQNLFDVTYSDTPVSYTPTILYLGSFDVVEGTDYTWVYTDKDGKTISAPRNAGTYYAVFTGKGKPESYYTGTKKVSFKILPLTVSPKASLTKTTYIYNGKYQKPAPVVKDGSRTYVNGTDYSVTYKNNKKVGKATVIVRMKGNYTADSKTLTFKIKPKKATVSKAVPGKKQIKVTMGTKVSATGGSTYQIKYRVKGASKWKTVTTTSKTKTIKNLKKGKRYQIKVRAYKKVNGVTYYGAWSKVKTTKKVK